MGRSVIGLPKNNFCIHCGVDKGGRVWVCGKCQGDNLGTIYSDFWHYVADTKDRMWNNAER